MMDVLEATRSVTEPAMQYWYVNALLSLVQRDGLPPHLTRVARRATTPAWIAYRSLLYDDSCHHDCGW